MTGPFSELSPDQLEMVLNAPSTRRTKDPFAERTYMSWWKLYTKLTQCDYCPNKHMCAEKKDGSMICRRCFITGKDSGKPSP